MSTTQTSCVMVVDREKELRNKKERKERKKDNSEERRRKGRE